MDPGTRAPNRIGSCQDVKGLEGGCEKRWPRRYSDEKSRALTKPKVASSALKNAACKRMAMSTLLTFGNLAGTSRDAREGLKCASFAKDSKGLGGVEGRQKCRRDIPGSRKPAESKLTRRAVPGASNMRLPRLHGAGGPGGDAPGYGDPSRILTGWDPNRRLSACD